MGLPCKTCLCFPICKEMFSIDLSYYYVVLFSLTKKCSIIEEFIKTNEIKPGGVESCFYDPRKIWSVAIFFSHQ